MDRYYLEVALAQAEEADREGSLLIGVVVVGLDGEVLDEGRNCIFAAGLQLIALLVGDDPGIAADRAAGRPVPESEDLPRFMTLAFRKP